MLRPLDLSDLDVELLVRSDDPARPEAALPLLAEAAGAPRLRLEPGRLDFGPVSLGAEADLELTLANDGTADLLVHAVRLDAPGFQLLAAPADVRLPPGASEGLLSVAFAPQGPRRRRRRARHRDQRAGPARAGGHAGRTGRALSGETLTRQSPMRSGSSSYFRGRRTISGRQAVWGVG